MSVATDYCNQIRDGLRRHANFPPDLPVALGDFGRIRDDVFERLGNISQLGLTFGVVEGVGKSSYSFKSEGGIDISLFAKGELGPEGTPLARAGLDLKFSRANAVFFAASGVTTKVIADLRALEAQLIQLLDEGQWEADFFVVTELSAAAKTTAVASASADSSIRLEASSPSLEMIHLGDASLELQVKRSRSTGLEIITESGHTPLMQLARLRGWFSKQLQVESALASTAVGGAPRFELVDADGEAVVATAEVAVTEGVAAASLALERAVDEVSEAAAAALGVQATPFEKARSLELYLPLLRASYSFAHGNPDAPLPPALEKLARVEAHVELTEAVEAVDWTPEAQQAVANDLRALNEEATRGVVTEGLGSEGIANPHAFGFVVRVTGTNDFIVSIRGTQTPEEWVKNFTAIPNPFSEIKGFGFVHLGFEQMWRRIRDSVFAGIGTLPAGARLTVVGHSLGGAMATLGAAVLQRQLGSGVNVDLWTVGCPRVGLHRFRGNFNRLVPRAIRVENQGDIVPHVPSKLQLFAHVGKEVDVKGRNGNAHSLDAYEDGIRKLGDQGITEAVEPALIVVPAAATL